MKKIVVLLLLISSFIWGQAKTLTLKNLNFEYTCDEGNLSSKVLFLEYRKAKVKLDEKRKKLKKLRDEGNVTNEGAKITETEEFKKFSKLIKHVGCLTRQVRLKKINSEIKRQKVTNVS